LLPREAAPLSPELHRSAFEHRESLTDHQVIFGQQNPDRFPGLADGSAKKAAQEQLRLPTVVEGNLRPNRRAPARG
jgi:hypothetical protein